MPESIRNMITPPRNSAPRDTTVTIPAPAVTEPSPVPAVSDEATIRARVMAEQKARMSGINDLFAMFAVAIRRFRHSAWLILTVRWKWP